ncbi:MarR family winged helix-turn-helix transcriptional regulator [Ampullimonas aquatilis]|uniref:MarR family winged helix-turn-helix transcriptional regulator n=1 Tax=Ampullimonas aquatilis TaxID=1341549 RepID=UPI003C72E9FB
MSNLKLLLLNRTEWFAKEIMSGMQNSPYRYLTPAQSKLLATMAGKPFSISELARRMAISRQAVHKTVTDLVKLGILALSEDPTNRTSKLVSYTEEGKKVNKSGADQIQKIEEAIAQKIGADNLAKLKEVLAMNWDSPAD